MWNEREITQDMGLVDIHCHLLYGVDDGAKSIEDSIAMLDVAVKEGITDMILTPHYRHGMFPYPGEAIRKHFMKLQPEAEKRGVHLQLGCECHVNRNIIPYLEERRVLPLAGSEYVLSEYAHDTEEAFIREMSMELLSHGYVPVIAHVERYECFRNNIDLSEALRRQGVWIQINADAVLGKNGFGTKRFCKRLLDRGSVDVIASDSHDIKNRRNHLGECYRYMVKHYGQSVADQYMDLNPRNIITMK